MRNQYGNGFTLIELMITVVVIAVLASIAVPSYRQYVIRSNRSAAKSAMMDIANREQQILLANRRYADKAGLSATGYGLPSEVAQNYDWDVTTPTQTTFTITLTAKGGQAADGQLMLNEQGVKSPLDKWER